MAYLTNSDLGGFTDSRSRGLDDLHGCRSNLFFNLGDGGGFAHVLVVREAFLVHRERHSVELNGLHGDSDLFQKANDGFVHGEFAMLKFFPGEKQNGGRFVNAFAGVQKPSVRKPVLVSITSHCATAETLIYPASRRYSHQFKFLLVPFQSTDGCTMLSQPGVFISIDDVFR